MIVWLPAIPEQHRRPEAELLDAFQKARPRILGALLDAVSGALRNLPSMPRANLPRMADFALWMNAAEAALGWPKGTFTAAYTGNQASANEVALEVSPIANPLLELLEEQGEWLGTSGELLQALEARVSDQDKRQRMWPKNAQSMSGHLKRLSPNFRAVGWQTDRQREASRRLWSIQRAAEFASSDPVPSSQADGSAVQTGAIQGELFRNDANDGHDANPGAFVADRQRNDEGWEEGDL